MARFDFDLEQAEQALDDAEDLLSVFWRFFNEERPLGTKADECEALWFVQNCKIYESVINAACDKVHEVRADMEAAINKHYHKDNDNAV